MESLPVEVVGYILSWLGAARDVAIASATCRKWREAWRTHIQSVTFNCNDWPFYDEMPTDRLETIITETIFRTKGLEQLSLHMGDMHEFSAAQVIAWLMYTRETLFVLHCNLRMTPAVNILEHCGWHKLEVLCLAHITISIVRVILSHPIFPCLNSLSLNDVSISKLDLSILLIACPRIKILNLVKLEVVVKEDSQTTMSWRSNSLKEIYLEEIELDIFILVADSLEKFHLKDCWLHTFVLDLKGMLRFLKFDGGFGSNLDDIGESAENLEIINMRFPSYMMSSIMQIISQSSKLRKLRLWNLVQDGSTWFLDLEKISSCCPLLSHLSLSYDLIHPVLRGYFSFENVTVLEIGWNDLRDSFPMWVERLVQRCPRLRKLVIHRVFSEEKNDEEIQLLANFTSSIVRLVRKYLHLEVQFEYA